MHLSTDKPVFGKLTVCVQVVVNYASSASAAEDVASQIKDRGGDAIVVGADLCKPEDLNRWASCLYNKILELHCLRLLPDTPSCHSPWQCKHLE